MAKGDYIFLRKDAADKWTERVVGAKDGKVLGFDGDNLTTLAGVFMKVVEELPAAPQQNTLYYVVEDSEVASIYLGEFKLWGEEEEEEPQYSVWGVDIDYTESDPYDAVTYKESAVGMTPGSAAWNLTALFANIKPCMFKNGAVNYYLDPDNFGKKADGVSNADITSGNDGDVMIEIPKLGYKIETVGNTLKVRVTDNPKDENFCYYAHTRTTEGDKDYLYVSAYKGFVDGSSVLRSLSGKTLTDGISMESFRAAAQAKGSGYDLLSFYPLTLLQCLYLIRYKSLDSQTALGEGYTKIGRAHV